MIIMMFMVLIKEFCSVDSMKTKWIHTVVISSLVVWTYSFAIYVLINRYSQHLWFLLYQFVCSLVYNL